MGFLKELFRKQTAQEKGTRAASVQETGVQKGNAGTDVKNEQCLRLLVLGQEMEKLFQAESYVAKTFFEFVQSYDPHADRIWILEYSGEIIGTIAVAAKGQNALLRWFLLDPSFRGLGLGKKLLTEAIDYCREKGYQEVLLGTAGDLLSALALYKKFGFEIIAQSENHEWRDHVTEIEMRLKLK